MMTIFSVISGDGGAVRLIRISGNKSFEIFQLLTQLDNIQHMQARVAKIIIHDEYIDEGVFLFFQNPKSFTGEDVLEICVHNSIYVIQQILRFLETIPNCRQATNGEFSRRAFLNGKMDIIQAEGINNLIHSITKEQHRLSIGMMDGNVSSFYQNLRDRLIMLMSIIEINIDFADEEIPEREFLKLKHEVTDIIQIMKNNLLSRRRADIVFNGINVAIVGHPNVGKSSLLNYLARKEVAIVYDEAGTTRDILYTDVVMNGCLVRFFDTAGIRETDNPIEQLGIQKALHIQQTADIVIYMTDIKEMSDIDEAKHDICIVNKIDLQTIPKSDPNIFYISLKDKIGLDKLEKEILKKVVSLKGDEPIMIVNQRHENYIQNAINALEGIDFEDNIEILAENLRYSLNQVQNIIGFVSHDDILDSVFSNFCIGK